MYDQINLTSNAFHKICRTCLNEGDMKDIFEESYMDKSVANILTFCASIQVEKKDLYPQNICVICMDLLQKIYNFINKCKESDDILSNIVRNDDLNKEFNKNERSKRECSKIIFYQDDSNDSSVKDENVANGMQCKEENIKIDCDDDEIENESNSDESEDDSIVETKSIEKQRKYKCKFCLLEFDRFIDLQSHKKEAKHPKRLNRVCGLCAKTFASPYLLKQHMRTHTKEKPYKCDVCEASFSNSSNLRRHKRIHSGERPHVCDLCGKAYTQSSILAEHKMTHSGEKPYVCNYCGKSFRAHANYKTHLTRHKMQNGEIPKEQHTKELENFKCKICERILSTKGALKQHMLTHGDKMFLCTHCGKGFVNKGGLRSHSRVHTGEKPYACRFCDKMFGLHGSLHQHELIHTGQKPYPCKLCPKAFVQHHQLQYHLRTHSGERPYVCSYCGKTFALNGNLKVHIRTHTGETPYVCTICDKGFYDSSSLKKHAKGHKGNNFLNDTQNDVQNI